MLTWVIIVVALAVLLSGFVQLLPKGRQRHLQRLRDKARTEGLAVEWLRESQCVDQLEGCIAYRMPLERCPMSAEFSCRRGDDQAWVWLNGSIDSPSCAEVLQHLPEQVRGIERQSLSALVYWREPDDMAPLEQLVKALQPLRHSA